jgi:hypothetical protein
VLAPLRQATLSQLELRFAKALPATLLTQNAGQAHSRERIYTLSRTFWCWIWQILQAQASCREVVRQVQALCALQDDARKVDEGNSAYCQARSHLSLAMLTKTFAASFQSAERTAATATPAFLGGRVLRVVDGSGSRLCDTPANRRAFAPSANLRPGTGFPWMRIVVLFSLASGAILAQATGSLHTGELRLWLDLLPWLKRGEVLLADRAYGKYVVVALLQVAGVDLLSSLARNFKVDFKDPQKQLGPQDALLVWHKPRKASAFVEPQRWQDLPAQVTVRVLRAQLARKGFRTAEFTLVTTLLDPVLYPASELLAAYARRWRLEMCLDDLKTTLGMEQMSCRTPAMVHKELLVFLTAHNLVRWLMVSAAVQAQASLECISFKGTLDAFRQWSQAMVQPRARRLKADALWRQLLGVIAADALPLRPGRSEPRAVKKRSKYPHLDRPRASYSPRPTRNKRRRIATARKNRATN